MIPNSSAGVQQWGYPLRAVHSGSGRADTLQTLGQFDPQSEKLSVPVPVPQTRQPAVVDLTTNGDEAQERGPQAKRPRLEVPAGSSIGDGCPVPMSGGEVKNTPVTATSKPPSLSWRSRPVSSFHALISDIPGGGDVSEENGAAVAQARRPPSPPPLPALPWKHTPSESLGSNLAGSRDLSPTAEVQTTPYHIEVPSIAPVLKGEKVADFSPWKGDHPEDVLNEQAAKQGHYDRTQVSQNESNTARPSLYAQLKHRSGLQMLSSVFAATLEKRQNFNMVITPSTFKPPPRVTLTDNKREAWLRDLANPSVPLRRLSRTIPHGIRGKVLLDQCLTKYIPVGRAVWLAKCVGANEIRAFKRKGTSGALVMGLEAKWVRDWTTNVQQFLDGLISACTAEDWKLKMTYAVSLTARLFFEHLLDHDQYLGWFLSSLEAAPLNTVPVWLLMVGIYWDNIMQYRKRGRRLAEVLLEKLYQTTQSEPATSRRPLVDRLSQHIRRLILEHTSSVIIPNSWDKYKDLLSSCLNLKDKMENSVSENLAERNTWVQQPKKCQEATQPPPPQQRVIHLLDSIRSTHDISSASIACLNIIEDKVVLVFKLLEWTATPFRHGSCRVYAAVRLLRKWKMSGIDIDSLIISFLGEVQGSSQLKMDNIYHVVSELVRSQTFSVGKYLQWLMAKGVADRFQPNQPEAIPGDLGLLMQLPVSRLPEHVRNLRNTLLHRAGITVSEEDSIIASLKASIAGRLPRIFSVETDSGMSCDLPQSNLTWAVKSEIGQWIRRGVTEHHRDPSRKSIGVSLMGDRGLSALNPDEFYGIRDILERFGDLSMLADVLKLATDCDDNTILASIADTVNYHSNSFCVIGATSDLFRRLIASYVRLKRFGIANLDLVSSLIELGHQIPNEFNTVSLLRQDISRIESKSALAAPSPLSDHFPSTPVEADPSFQEKLDRLLSSGSGMDEPTLDALFNALIKILECGDDQAKLSANETCRYLAHLRPFHPKHFDAMLVRWIYGLLTSSTRSILPRILPPLIGVGCVAIHAFVFLVQKLLQSEKETLASSNIGDLRIDLLELLVPPTGQSRYFDLVTYRFYLAQQEFLIKHAEEAFRIIHDAMALLDSVGSEDGLLQRRPDLASCAIMLLHVLLTQNPEAAAQYCAQKLIGQHLSFMTVLTKALDLLLGFDSRTDPQRMPEAERVITMTNDFSVPFCQLKLQILFNAESGGEVKNGIVEVMFKAAVADSRSRQSNWLGLVNLMSRDAARQIRERAEKGFFSIPLLEESIDDNLSAITDDTSSFETAKLYLTMIEKLAYSIPDGGVQFVAPILVEKMDLLLHKLITMQTACSRLTENSHGVDANQVTRSRSNFERGLAFWFSALLRMVVLHRSAFNMSSLAPKSNSLQEQTRLLISIFCITLGRLPDNATAEYFPHLIQSGHPRPCPSILLQTHALDVAASLIDSFPDEARHQCARFLRDKCPSFLQIQSDSPFHYLLGPIMDTAALNPPLPVSLPSPAASGSTPTPTPSGNFSGGPSNPQQPVSASSGMPTVLPDSLNCVASHLRLQYRGRLIGAYPVRSWELLEDAAPIVGVNDTAVSLGYFDARRVRA